MWTQRLRILQLTVKIEYNIRNLKSNWKKKLILMITWTKKTLIIGWKSQHINYNRSRVEGIGWKPWLDDYNRLSRKIS